MGFFSNEKHLLVTSMLVVLGLIMKACISSQPKLWTNFFFAGVSSLLCLLVKQGVFATKYICIFFLHEYILLWISQMLLTPVTDLTDY